LLTRVIGRISRSNSRDVPSGVGTVAWKLQREIILLLGWGPAILLQLAHPLVARGVADHSAFRTERWGSMRRLYRTLDAMLGLCFKTEREALAVVARINAVHDRVNGRLTEAAGIFPAGTPYSAHDPNLLAWVHATLLDMNLRVYELFVTPLRIEEKDTDPGRHQTGAVPVRQPTTFELVSTSRSRRHSASPSRGRFYCERTR
jgi:uncharacterized protein (DUF2236 family)